MDSFYEEDERIVGHAADAYHRIDIRLTSRHLVVRHKNGAIAESAGPTALYESGFAPRWYVPRADVDETALTPADGQTFCPCKGLCRYYDIGEAHRAAWSYQDAWPEVRRVSGLISLSTGSASNENPRRREPARKPTPSWTCRDPMRNHPALRFR